MNGFKEKINSLLGNSFFRDVSKLSFGTLAGRLVTFIALPFITRLYSPSDFSILAVYLALVSIFSVVVCLRFDIAIPLADNDIDAIHLLVLALSLCLIFVFLLLIITLTIPDTLASIMGHNEITAYIWLVPIGIFFSATYSALQFWTTRKKRFGSIARTRITQAISGVTASLGLGWLGFAPSGLLIGNMLNIGAGGYELGKEAFRKERSVLADVTVERIGRVFQAYRRYVIYSTPDALANIAGTQIPILLIAAFANEQAGFLLLAMQVMTTPMSLLGASISQVYTSRAAEKMKAGQLAEFTLGIMQRLIFISVAPLILAGLLAPLLVPWIFGAEWSRTGLIIAWMVPWIALQFIGSPVSMVMYVTGHQRAMLVLNMLGVALRVGPIILLIAMKLDYFVPVFTLGSAVYYFFVIAQSTYSAQFQERHYLQLLASLPIWYISAISLAILLFLIFAK